MSQFRRKKPSRGSQKDSRVTEIYRYRDFLAPRYWPVWLNIGALFVIAWLPWRLKLGLTSFLCWVVKRFAKSRYQTLKTNIHACFGDEFDADRLGTLVEEALFSNVLGLVETAHAWFRGTSGLEIEVEGREHYEAAKAQGRGVLVLSSHFSMLDLGAAIISDVVPTGTIYRRHDNPLFNYFMTRSREKYIQYTIARRDIKEMIRRLRGGDNLAYLPDQDFGRKRSIFVPFFGVPTATITMTSQIAEAGNAVVLPVSAHRIGRTPRYVLSVHPPMNIPTDDHVKDTRLWTAWLEDRIREHPEQYLWFHKRFKTRPEGEPSLY